MSVKNSVGIIPLTSIDSSTLSGTYQLVTTLPQACFYLKITNSSNEDVFISDNGTDNKIVVLTETFTAIPSQQNSQPNNNVCLFSKGTQIWAKGTAGTGTIYVEGYYQVVAN